MQVNKMAMAFKAFPSRLGFKGALLVVSLLFPLGVAALVALLSLTFLSRDECEREFCLPEDIRLVG